MNKLLPTERSTRTTGRKSWLLALTCLAVLALPFTSARAASHTWSGAVNGLFSNAGNWSAGGVPTLAETNILVFPVGATRFTVTNDIGALKVSAFNFSGGGYTVRGGSTLSIEANLVNLNSSGGSNTIESSLAFVTAASIAVGSDDALVLSGLLSGTSGLVKNGTGPLYLRGVASNPLSGSLSVNSGKLHFQKSGGASPYNGNSISIGSTNVMDQTQLYLGASDQISDAVNVTIHPSGALLLNGFSDIVNSVTMHSGTLDTGAGTLVMNAGLFLTPRFIAGVPNVYESPTILGTLEFGGTASTLFVSNQVCNVDANIVENGSVTVLNKTGAGTLGLKGGGNFTGALNIQQGRVIAYTSSSLGSIAGGTTVSNGATLEVRTGVSSAEPLALTGLGEDGQGALQATGNATMSGLVSLAGETGISVISVNGTLNLDSPISGGGGIRKFGDGFLSLNGFGNNTFSGASFVAKGQLTLNKGANVRAIGSVTVTNGASLVFGNNELMDNAGVLSIYTGGSVNLLNRNETIGGLNMGGLVTVDMGTGTLTLLGNTYVGAPYSLSNYVSTIVKGRLSLGGAVRQFSTPVGSGIDLVLDCEVLDGGGTGGIWLTNGSIYLARSNSFTGPVSIKGYCGVSNSFAFGAAGGGITLTNDPGTGTTLSLRLPSMTITGEALTNNGAGVSVAFYGASAWNGPIVNSGTLGFDGDVGAQMTVDAPISGSGNLWHGGGTLRLLQANTYAGTTEVYGGPLVVGHPQALGTSAAGTLLHEGATLRLELLDGAAITNESLTFEYNGLTGHTNNLILVAGAVSNAWTGPVTLPIPAQVRVTAPAGTFAILGVISGPGSLEKQGPGKLVLAGTQANTYSGDTVVTDGTLVLNKPNGVQAVSNLMVNPLAQLEWAGSEQIADGATLRLHSASADTGGYNETLTHLAMDQSLIFAGTGILTLLGDIDATRNPGNIYGSGISGRLHLSGGIHRMYSSSDPAFLGISADIGETNGAATLVASNLTFSLSGSNTFSGPVHLSATELFVGHSSGLGSPAQGVIADQLSALVLDLPSGQGVAGESFMGTNNPVLPSGTTRIGPTNTIFFGYRTNFWSGPIIMGGTLQLTGPTNLSLELSGPVTSLYLDTLYSSVQGTLFLTGANSNSLANMIMTDGTLRMAKSPGASAVGSFLYAATGAGSTSEIHVDAPGQIPATAVIRLNATSLFLHDNTTLVNGLTANESYSYINCGTNPSSALIVSNNIGGWGMDFFGEFRGTFIKQGTGVDELRGDFLNGDLLVQGGTLNRLCNGFAFQTVIAPGAVVNSSGAQIFNFGALSGGGTLNISGGNTWLGAGQSSTFAGAIAGSMFTKLGTGALTLTGPIALSSETLVQNGTLLVNTVVNNPVRVERATPNTTATLGGTGTVGNLTVVGIGARLAPGATTNVPSYGKLTAVNVAVVDGAIYACEIGGTNAGVNLDQIEATDTFTLSGVTPSSGVASFTAFGAGATSNRYAVVKSFTAVNGTFQGDPEGDYIYPAAGRAMVITYLTAAGKEITLIEQAGSPVGNFSVTGITQLTNGYISLVGTGAPSAAYFVLASTNLNTTNWVQIGNVTGHAFTGNFSFTDTNAASFLMRFYRFLLP